MFAALEEDAPRTEWALKMDVSTPAACNRAFNHRATVQEVTDLCGLMRAKASFVSPFLRLSILSSYALRVVTGHNRELVGKVGKKNSEIGLPCRDCLARQLGKKVTPSGVYCLAAISNKDKSVDRDGLVKASSMATFQVNCFRDKVALSPKESR